MSGRLQWASKASNPSALCTAGTYLQYPGQPGGGIMSLVGAHLDVVTANPDAWEFGG